MKTTTTEVFDIDQLKIDKLEALINFESVCRLWDIDDCCLYSIDPRDASLWMDALVQFDEKLIPVVEMFTVEVYEEPVIEDGKVRYSTNVYVPKKFREQVTNASMAVERNAHLEIKRLGGIEKLCDLRDRTLQAV